MKTLEIHAREILDSRGYPTLEVDLTLQEGNHSALGRASVPSGASKGSEEAQELRDQDHQRYCGKGVLQALKKTLNILKPQLLNQSFSNQTSFDTFLCQLDGTAYKSNLGANTLLACSIAFLRAHAKLQRLRPYAWIAKLLNQPGNLLPVPCINILNGGKHADNGLAIQEFMIIPAGFHTFPEALRAGAETFHALKKILIHKKLHTGVGDEGGFAPCFTGQNPHEQALACVLEAIHHAGYQPGRNIFLAMDAAATEFYSVSDKTYFFENEHLTASDLIALYQKWTQKFPIISIEDGLSEKDDCGWQTCTQALQNSCQLVGDDLFVTHPKKLQQGIENHLGNAILIKPNQIGTLSETFSTLQLAQQHDFKTIISHRSGETEDPFIADLAVGSHAGQIKAGSVARSDRTVKYNQLLRLHEHLGHQAQFAGLTPYQRWL